jgi:geranylgeranyl reductase family protein
VGAGTAGCIAARELAQGGAKVLVLEEDIAAGKQGKCTAIFSKAGMESLGVDYSRAVLNEIRGAKIHAGNTLLEIDSKETKALVLDRFIFDAQCAIEAKNAGVKIMFAEKASSFSRAASGAITVETQNALSGEKSKFSAKFLVGADGLSSPVAKAFSFPGIPARDFVLCYEAEYANAFVRDERAVEIFLDANGFPGFFAWIVPCGESCVRVGFGTDKPALLDAAKQKFFSESTDVSYALVRGRAKKKREFYALIPLHARSKTQDGNVLLVGDAAGQVKATTGGGVIFGGLCAKIAAEEILAALKGGGMPQYEKKWREKYGKTLSLHRFIRSFYNLLGNWSVQFFVRAAGFLGVNKFLEKRGDMDYVLR